MRCFPLPENSSLDHWDKSQVYQWYQHHADSDLALNQTQRSALARLVPLLLCGEQSAVLVFNTENSRLQQCQQESVDYLAAIESDERHHEIALQLLTTKLPKPSDVHRIKRSAQRFYTRIAQETNSIAEHFATIAALDRCVSILMHTVARSSIKGTITAELFELIKKDEARHVRIAQQHCDYLQEEQAPISKGIVWIESALVDLLGQQREAFEALGIDSSVLFQRLLNARSTEKNRS